MHPEQTRLEKLSAIVIGLSLMGYFIFKAGALKTTCDALLAASVLFFMMSKTIRCWKYLGPSIKTGWIILIVAFFFGSVGQVRLHNKTGDIVALISIVIFTISFNNTFKKWREKNEPGTN